MKENFLPISKADLLTRGWSELDIILITGDAYVDHPSYGAALIGRLLEHYGFKVGIIPQPNWRSSQDFLVLGKPRLFFGITSGNVDSLVANYTANKKPRKTDDYSPGGKAGFRPDRAVIVYANKVKEAFPETPIILGGIEASLRRLAHYDYWDNSIRRSILLDAKADILVYGMGESPILEIANELAAGKIATSLNNIRGTVVVRKDIDFLKDYLVVPSFPKVKEDKEKFIEAFKIAYSQMNPATAKPLVQKYDSRFLIQFPPSLPLSTKKLDEVYSLPYVREWHPIYNQQGGIKGFEVVRFSITSHRGCCGECAFCALYSHQGRIVQSRSQQSIIEEAKLIANSEKFRGIITDIGGPTANLYQANCAFWEKDGYCLEKKCLIPTKCQNLQLGYKESLTLYRKLREIPQVRHVFISSGFRYDLLIENYAQDYLQEICQFHTSGQLKVAPEHISPKVLQVMNKPAVSLYEKFVLKFTQTNQKLKKRLFLVNYFLSAHPAAGIKEAKELAQYLTQRRIHPEQIQDFTPTPMTLSTCIYYTETHPFTGEKIYIPKTFGERKEQREIIQSQNKKFPLKKQTP